MSQYWDSVIEVFDTDSHALLASIRLDEYLSEFADCGHVAGPAFENGLPIVIVLSVKLDQGMLIDPNYD